MENRKELIFRYRIWWHLLFWLFWYLFYYVAYTSDLRSTHQFENNLYLIPARVLGTYTFIYWVLPKFLFTKKYSLFAFFTMVHAILFGIAIWQTMAIVAGVEPAGGGFPVIRPIILNYQIPATATAIVIFKRWYLIQQYSLKLEKETLEAELRFLKAQLHPHFLFNTLNNLYALALKKSDKTPDVVIQLSSLLDHMLYSSKESVIKLEDDLNYLQEYIELEKIRYGERLQIETEVTGDLEGKLIAPLILLPFVENSFKHGASRDTGSPLIEIKIHIQGLQLMFHIRNTYVAGQDGKDIYSEGIGLSNVKRRLELIYPKKHQLEIIKDGKYFQVLLIVELIEEIETGKQRETLFQTNIAQP